MPLPFYNSKDFLNKTLNKTCKGREKQAQIKQGMVGSITELGGDIECHAKVLSRGLLWYDLCFKKFFICLTDNRQGVEMEKEKYWGDYNRNLVTRSWSLERAVTVQTERNGFGMYSGRIADRVGTANLEWANKDKSKDFWPEQLGSCDVIYWNGESKEGNI